MVDESAVKKIGEEIEQVKITKAMLGLDIEQQELEAFKEMN